jgi:hypothetical protein
MIGGKTIPAGAGPLYKGFQNLCADHIGQGKRKQKKTDPVDQLFAEVHISEQQQKEIDRNPCKLISEKGHNHIAQWVRPVLIDLIKEVAVCLNDFM